MRIVLLQAALGEVLQAVGQFLDILLLAHGFWRVLTRHILYDTTRLDDADSQFVGVALSRFIDEARHQFLEAPQLRQRALRYVQRVGVWMADHLPETHRMLRGLRRYLSHRGVTDATCRIVHYTLECLLVVRIYHQSEVSYDVLDFLALVERQTAIHAVRERLLAKLLLEHAALCVGAVENGKVRVGQTLLAVQLLDLVGHYHRLLRIAVGLIDAQRLARLVLGEHLLRYATHVLLYQAVGRLYYGLRRTVVLFQFEDLRPAERLSEVQYVVYLRPAERVDALRIVAHHTHLAMLQSQLHHDAVLRVVRILILIHQDVFESVLILRQNVRMLLEENVSVEQQIVEVHRIRLLQSVPVVLVDVTHLRDACRAVGLIHLRIGSIASRCHQSVLGIADAALHRGRLIHLLVQSHLLDDAAQ